MGTIRSRGVGSVSLSVLLAAVAAVGCQTERIVVVHEPAPPVATAAPASTLAVATSNVGGGDDAEGAGEGASGDSDFASPPPSLQGQGTWGIVERDDRAEYAHVVQKVATMVSDGGLASRVSRRGLSLVNVAWEDTGRAQASSVGPNISDLTLQVRRRDERGGFAAALMPVIRPPNFVDRTGDIPADKFFVRVGNERSGVLHSVALTDVLRDLSAFASAPDSLLGATNFLAPRDSHFLVSAQAVFLPIPKNGKAEFNPVLFNYQSAPGAPAVMSILVTRQGTSIRVIENRGEDRSSSGSGQEIYFNNKGQRASFTAERKSDVTARIEAKGGPSTEDEASAVAKGADVLFLVQVPLMHEARRRAPVAMDSMGGMGSGASASAPKKSAPAPQMAPGAMAERSDVEQAVLGHGPNLGPFREGFGTRLVRDPRFPIRVTVQFYKATSNGVVSDIDLDGISRSIGGVYEHADAVGSLVMPEGDPKRPTAWKNIPRQWFPW